MNPTEPGNGHEKPRCGAKRHQGEGTCAKPAGWGTNHVGIGRCRLHGGSTRDHVKAAKKQIAQRAMETYGLPIEINPVDALLDEVHRTAGHVAWLGGRVRELSGADLVWSKTKEVDKAATENPGVDTTESAVTHMWLQLYRAERKHLVDVTKTAIAAGIEERRVQLAEAQGTMLATVIRAVLDDLHLSAEQRAMVPDVVPRHLRAVA